MKRKNWIKLALDLIMLVILLLMYQKNILSMTFHEIGGIAVCGLFIIHKLLNGKWIRAVSGKLFARNFSLRCKLNWVIDFLLLVCFAVILLSGMKISQVLFDGLRGQSTAKIGHYAASALALALIGVHVGMHIEFISKRLHTHKIPPVVRRVTAIVLSVAILGFGIYQMTQTSYLHWISNLSTISDVSESTQGEAPAALPEGEIPSDDATLSDGTQADDGAAVSDTDTESLTASDTAETVDTEDAVASDTEDTTISDADDTTRGGGLGNGNGNQARNSEQIGASSVWDVLYVVLQYAAIAFSFTVVTAWIDGVICWRKRTKRLKKAR